MKKSDIEVVDEPIKVVENNEVVPTETTELPLEENNDVIDVKGKKKVKTKKGLFVASIIMASISFLIFVLSLIALILFSLKFQNDTDLAIIFFVIVIFIIIPLMIAAVSELFATIALVNASILFKKEKTPRSITMFSLSLVEMLFLPTIIILTIILYR